MPGVVSLRVGWEVVLGMRTRRGFGPVSLVARAAADPQRFIKMGFCIVACFEKA